MRIVDGCGWGWIVVDTSSIGVLGSMTSRVMIWDELRGATNSLVLK